MKNFKNTALALAAITLTGIVTAQTPKFTGPNLTTTDPPKIIAITGGKLLTITHGTIDNGVLILENGRITAVGTAGTAIPKGAQIFDAKGMTVYPGLFDAETHLGLTEVESDENSNDLAETSDEIMPQMRVVDAFHAETVRIPVQRINGVTTAIVAPASEDTIAGQDALIQLYGRDRNAMIVTPDIALAMNFIGDVRRKGSGRGASKFPSTRMGLASQLRQTFLDAQNYMAEQAAAAKPDHKGPPPKVDLKFEALIPYLKGEKPVVLAADESYEVEVAMSIAHEFHLKVILNHVTHAQDLLDTIASYKVSVIVGSIYSAPRPNERYDAVYSLPAELQKRGVKIAFSSLSDGPTSDSRNLPYAAGYAVAYGLPYDEAMKALTLNPAEMFGVADKQGSLDTGKVANVVIANGDPLDVRTSVQQVFIGGVPIPMTSRQTQLRDQYLPLSKTPTPK
ncbi:amidohydrolase family protein [Granulicella sibirica]|uniref:Metallo-dependent hydrolase n=1 Tax=Granulicella sibirica TaxID=2479048 RepID=A0A4Q0T2T3_9BACT|nr:amidohydrolase family protein [Granulicella sibirica]RXH56338.1 Metallo-dependent hydrolase [Granulicella sibirica]